MKFTYTPKSIVVRWLRVGPTILALALGLTSVWADWPPLNPNVKTFFVQHPDATTNGIDVLACPLPPAQPPYLTTTLADDWICRGPSPVTDIHIWGSWLNDQVDPNTTFWLAIWSDVPAANGLPSHPGELLWQETFTPGRYQARLWRSGVEERFLNPSGPIIMGADNQIWQYNFYLKNPFYQQGQPYAPIIYWLSVQAKPNTLGPNKLFGWKTTRDHFNDAAVFSPMMVPFGQPPASWSVLKSPAQKPLELAFAMTSSQLWAVNKNFYNLLAVPVTNIRVRWRGPFAALDHFDGPTANPWTYSWELDPNNDTVLNWIAPGATVLQPSQCIHTGFMSQGIYPPVLNWGWWDPFASVWLGDILQIDLGWPRLLLPNVPFNIGITNIQPPPPPPPLNPYANFIHLDSLKVEYHSSAIPLDTLNDTAVRTPLEVVTVPVSPAEALIAPGANMQFTVPIGPMPNAQYAVVIPQFSPVNSGGQAMTDVASTDWIMLPAQSAPVDPTTPPPLLLPPAVSSGEITLTWTAMPGAIYQVQRRSTLSAADAWEEIEGNVIASSATADKTVPLSGDMSFYRVVGVGP
ncbi:MAG TPA: hypothetical protein PLC99_25480 [Verrucomicrobiota bacterium]|nr:hypothetical protein [Verrucomicrobiota bacterium]